MHYLEQELNTLLQTDSSIFRFLQEGSLDGVWYWDLQNPEHEWMSPEFWRLFGCDPSEKLHTPDAWMTMIHPEDLVTAQANFEAHLADPDHAYDQVVRYRYADGERWITVRCRGVASRDADGTPVRMLGAHTDLTALKCKEDALTVANASLSEANRKVAQALQEKTAFLETMSHEIKTPLNGILGMAELLVARNLSPQDHKYAEVICASARRLVDLMSGVLDLTRIEAGVLHDRREKFNVAETLRGVVELFEPDAVTKGLNLNLMLGAAALPHVVGSERSLNHVVINLVSNALKFTSTGEIVLSAELQHAGSSLGTDLVVRVADTGPGVPVEDREVIFARFGRADAAKGTAGTGLGLTIARSICEAHGGSLRVEETRGGGSTFIAHFAVEPCLTETPSAVQTA